MPLNIILPTKAKYEIGSDFPFMSIPLDVEEYDPQPITFDDFQWWCYSGSFKKWLKSNPRKWVADSEDFQKKYSNDFTEIINEYYSEKYGVNLGETKDSDVISFDEFSRLNEEKNPDANVTKTLIKLHYAYNTLKSQGKITSMDVENDMKIGTDVAVFLSVKGEGDPEEGLTAFRMKAIGGNDKIRCVSVIESIPGGEVKEKTASAVFEKVLKYALLAGAAAIGGFAAFGALKVGGTLIGGQYILRNLRGLKNPNAAESLKTVAENAATRMKAAEDALNAAKASGKAKDIKAASKAYKIAVKEADAAKQAYEVSKKSGVFSKAKNVAGKGLRGIKGLGKTLLDVATFKETRDAVKYGAKGAKTSLQMTKNVKDAATRGTSAAKYFGRNFGRAVIGTGSKASGKTASRLIPFVGEVLLAVDMVGSAINWFSDKQAPTWGDIEETIGNSGGSNFKPAEIKVGEQITICWKQPAGSTLGAVGSFFYSNDTRTTAELIKVGNTPDNDKSVFIILAINSKEYQKQLSNYAAALVVIKNKEWNESSSFLGAGQRIFDNEDMDAELVLLKNPDDIAVPFTFLGFCDWNQFKNEYDNSEDQLIIADGRAPETYDFYYKRPEGEYVNVSGKIMSTEELEKTSSEELNNSFALSGENKNAKPSTNESFTEPYEDDSLNENEIVALIVSNGKENGVKKFSDFESLYESASLGLLFEKDGDEGGIMKLTSDQSSGPAEVAIYKIRSNEFANPEDKQYSPGYATHFVIDPSDYDAANNDPITASLNSDDVMIDPRRGIYVYKEERKDDDKKDDENEEDGKLDTSPIVSDDEKEDGKKVDDYYITVDPDDVSIKNRKSSTVIRDKNFKGGLNIMDEFLTDRQKEILGIEDWNAVTFAKARMDRKGDVIEIKLRNKYAPMGRRTMKYSVSDGEPFEIAKKFASDVEDRIKYQ